jgi:hypothetical protein
LFREAENKADLRDKEQEGGVGSARLNRDCEADFPYRRHKVTQAFVDPKVRSIKRQRLKQVTVGKQIATQIQSLQL